MVRDMCDASENDADCGWGVPFKKGEGWRVIAGCCVCVVLLLVQCAEASAQSGPVAEVSGGYAFLHDFDYDANPSTGWFGDVNVSVTDWVGIMGSISGNYLTEDSFGVAVARNEHAFVGGARFTIRREHVAPFVQYLMGARRRRVRIEGSSGPTRTKLTAQIGVGAIVGVVGDTGLRVGGDFIFTDPSLHGRQLQLSTGLVYALGKQ